MKAQVYSANKELLVAASEAVKSFPSITLKVSKNESAFAFVLSNDAVFPFTCIVSMVEAHADAIEALHTQVGTENLYLKELSKAKESKNGIYFSKVARKAGFVTQLKVTSVFSDRPEKKSVTVNFDENKIDKSFLMSIARQIKENETQGIPVSYEEAKKCFKFIIKNYYGASTFEFVTKANGWFDEKKLESVGEYHAQPVIRSKGSRMMPDNTSFQSKHGRGNIIISKGGKRMSLSFNSTPIKNIQLNVIEWLKENVTETLQINDMSKSQLRNNWKAFLRTCGSIKEVHFA